jgi:hypothetical protein
MADAVLFCRVEKKDSIDAIFLLRADTLPQVLESPIRIAKIQVSPKSGQTARFSVASCGCLREWLSDSLSIQRANNAPAINIMGR